MGAMSPTITNWGPVQSEIKNAMYALKSAQQAQGAAERKHQELLDAMRGVNNLRREWVLNLLQKENKAICTMHKYIHFRSGPSGWLCNAGEAQEATLNYTRLVDNPARDGYVRETKKYVVVACASCLAKVRRAQVLAGETLATLSLDCNKPVSAAPPRPNYPEEILDLISEQYYNMPVVTEKNLESL